MSEGQQQADALARQVALAQQDAIEKARLTPVPATIQQIVAAQAATEYTDAINRQAPVVPKTDYVDAINRPQPAKPITPTVPIVTISTGKGLGPSQDVSVITPTNYTNPTVIKNNPPSISNQILTIDYRMSIQKASINTATNNMTSSILHR